MSEIIKRLIMTPFDRLKIAYLIFLERSTNECFYSEGMSKFRKNFQRAEYHLLIFKLLNLFDSNVGPPFASNRDLDFFCCCARETHIQR
jgi:hypothetical protein